MKVGTRPRAPRFGPGLRILFALARWLARVGLYPSVDRLRRLPPERRKAIKPAAWMTYPLPAQVSIATETIAGRGGPIAMKRFATDGSAGRPELLFIHGGGWISGGIDSLDYLCGNLSADLDVTVSAVDYRLAPEAPYPAALEDCYDALTWLAREERGANPTAGGVAVIGDSAGGNLAAALCLLARSRGGPAILHQTLIYPALDATLGSPSLSNGTPGFDRDDIAAMLDLYRGEAAPTDPLLSPLLAADLSGLPPALILTADGDPLRDDGNRYAVRLSEAGVAVRYTNYLDMPHGFLSMPRLCRAAPQALSEIVRELSRCLVLSLLLVAVHLGATGAAAQSIDEPVGEASAVAGGHVGQIEEIVVTATKREENLREIPASIAALPGEELEQRGAQSAEDIVKLVPGVNLTATGDSPQRVTIRGISSDIGTGSTTGVLFGNVSFTDAYVPFVALDPNPFDLSRVEVLKGPQGTLYGASALNGAIRYVPQPPQFGVWEARYFAQYTDVAKGGGAPTYGAAVNAPIGAGDDLALRLVGFRRDSPGYVDNVRTGTKDANSIDQSGLRGILAGHPVQKLDFTLTYAWQKTDLNDTSVTDNRDGDLIVRNRPRASPNHTSYHLIDLTAGYDFGWARLISDTSFVHKSGDNFFEASSRIIPGGELPLSAQVYSADSGTLGQEIRLVSADDGESPWKWVLGGFWWRQHVRQTLDVPLGDGSISTATLADLLEQLGPGLGQLFVSSGEPRILGTEPDVTIRELALFGDVTRSLGQDWEVSVGGRLYRTTSGGTNTQRGLFVLAQRGTPEYVLRGEVKESAFNPKASLVWHATDDILLYTAAAKGFRVGGVQVGITTPLSQNQAPNTFKSDTLWNYELGLRTQWFDRTLRLDATGFLVDWKHPQTLQADASGLVVFIDNVGGVESKGVDLSLQYLLPIPGLTLTTSASYADTVTSEPFTAANGRQIAKGERWPLAPRWQTATTLSSVTSLFDWTLSGFLTHTYLGEASNDLVQRTPIFGYQQWDAQLGIANPSFRWLPEVFLTVNNLLDERGITNQFSSRVPTPETAATDVYYTVPRAITVRLMGRFG